MSSEREYNLHTAAYAWRPAKDATVSSNALTVTIAGIRAQRIQIGQIALTNTTGAGGSPLITVNDGTNDIWKDAFVVATPYSKSFATPLVGAVGANVVITASATTLSTGMLYVSYRILPD